MNWYPQLVSGASVQLPVNRTQSWRNISNELESGESINVVDLHGGQVSWDLTYQALSDSEVGALTGFFTSERGKLGSFGFADPLANLLAGSEDLSRSEWSAGTMTVVGGASSPDGGTGAWALTNVAAGSQELQQTVALSGGVSCCFSFWVKSLTPTAISMRRDSIVTSAVASPVWRRFWISGTGEPQSSSTTIALGIPAGVGVQVWGFQLETQPYPGKYMKTSAAAGLYLKTSFAQDELTVIKTAPGLSACKVKLISRT